MKPLKVHAPAGADVQIVELFGNPSRPEPTHFRVQFPGGEVDIARAEGSYWVHVSVKQSDPDGREGLYGRIMDARLDIKGRCASEVNAGDFGHPELYHLAVRVEPKELKCRD